MTQFLTEYSKGGYLYVGFADAENAAEAQKICDARGLREKVVGPVKPLEVEHHGADVGPELPREGRSKG